MAPDDRRRGVDRVQATVRLKLEEPVLYKGFASSRSGMLGSTIERLSVD